MSLLDWIYPDDLTRHLAALIKEHSHHEDLEIEGKLGRIINGSSKQKLTIPIIASQMAMLDGDMSGHAFESSLNVREFKHLTETILKNRVENELHAAHMEKRAPRFVYTHPILIDHFYQNGIEQAPVRVTYDQTKNSNVQPIAVSKHKLAHMDVVMPALGPLVPVLGIDQSPLARIPPIDYRITIAREKRVEVPHKSVAPFMIRKKDRRCYELVGQYRVDCTTVETWTQIAASSEDPLSYVGAGPSKTTYEVELEICQPMLKNICREAQKLKAGQHNNLLAMTRSCIENCRTMARIAIPDGMIPPSCQPRSRAPPVPQSTQSNDESRKRARVE